MVSPLSDKELPECLASVCDWQYDAAKGGSIRRQWVFADFAHAFGFMTRVALLAHEADHHPEWRNVYNRVEIVMTTHDAGGLTRLDFDFASRADAAMARYQAG